MEPTSKFLAQSFPIFRKGTPPRQPYIRYADLLAMVVAAQAPRRDLLHLRPQAVRPALRQELEKVIQRTRDPAHRQILERMRGFDWIVYIAASVRHAASGPPGSQERTHDVAMKLLIGTLFRGFDDALRARWTCGSSGACPTPSGTSSRRSGTDGAAADRLHRSGVRARRRDRSARPIVARPRREDHPRLPPIGPEATRRARGRRPRRAVGGRRNEIAGRQSVARKSGQVDGEEGRLPDQGTGREFFQGDPELLRRVEKAMAAEEETVAKRRAATAARRAGGGGVDNGSESATTPTTARPFHVIAFSFSESSRGRRRRMAKAEDDFHVYSIAHDGFFARLSQHASPVHAALDRQRISPE